jgi:DNA-binding NarL/FixJ family response regulator
MSVRVVIADDQALVRVGLRGIIDSEPGLAVVGEAATGRQAVDAVRRARPDVVLMDIRMPDTDGIEATRRITELTPDTKVLVLTTFDLDEYVFAALHAGASGFLLKDALPDQLLTAVRTVAAGEALLAPTATRRLINAFVRQAPPRPPLPALALPGAVTERETEVLRLVATGLTNAEIAQRMHITHATVKTHVTHLLTKLGARDRIQLVILAHQSGIVPA